MTGTFDDMVAIASGSATQVDGWAEILRSSSIKYAVATSTQRLTKDAPNHVELWVHKKDADRASTLLRESMPANGPFLW
jgi:hypothetical protein